jgi:predicted secreted protein
MPVQKSRERSILYRRSLAMKRAALAGLALAVSVAVFAGDIAAFQNLGFSADSRYFMFGQYGVAEKGGESYADIFVVDVPRNTFVPGTNKSLRSKTAADPASSGIGALFALFRDAVPLAQKHAVDHTVTGRPLYILVDGAEPKDTIEFRDFPSGASYKVTLYQSSTGTGDAVESSFHIALTHTKGDAATTYTIGLPHFARKGVKRYAIKQIILAPDEKSLVVGVERQEANGTPGGFSARYMVETLRLDGGKDP